MRIVIEQVEGLEAQLVVEWSDDDHIQRSARLALSVRRNPNVRIHRAGTELHIGAAPPEAQAMRDPNLWMVEPMTRVRGEEVDETGVAKE